MSEIFNRNRTKRKRQRLRRDMTPAERKLWNTLRNRQLLGYKFRRQFGVEEYILDFYCPALKLVVEVDGDSHFRSGSAQQDALRTRRLEKYGMHVVRFLNSDIQENLDNVVEQLADVMRQRALNVRGKYVNSTNRQNKPK
jgi:very-short-patch-repair endonuclease